MNFTTLSNFNSRNKTHALYDKFDLELFFWIIGLIYLALINSGSENHFSICPLNYIGLDFCPGCGLGNSISYLFKGDFLNSFYSHPFGIFALIVIVYRIITLIIKKMELK